MSIETVAIRGNQSNASTGGEANLLHDLLSRSHCTKGIVAHSRPRLCAAEHKQVFLFPK